MTAAAIALLGTSADPPTRGHQVLLEGLLNRYGQVATWASDNPLKQHDAPLELRAMLLGELPEHACGRWARQCPLRRCRSPSGSIGTR